MDDEKFRAAVIAFLFEIGRHVGMAGSRCTSIIIASGVDRDLVDEIVIGSRYPKREEREEDGRRDQ